VRPIRFATFQAQLVWADCVEKGLDVAPARYDDGDTTLEGVNGREWRVESGERQQQDRGCAWFGEQGFHFIID
jgi:hypothetical protein